MKKKEKEDKKNNHSITSCKYMQLITVMFSNVVSCRIRRKEGVKKLKHSTFYGVCSNFLHCQIVLHTWGMREQFGNPYDIFG